MLSHSKNKYKDQKKTKIYILSAIKAYKNKQYEKLSDLFFQIRTNNLRDVMEEMEPNHSYYTIVLNVLKDERLSFCHKEALYNLAVFLGKKQNVEYLMKEGSLDIALSFINSNDEQLKHHAIWCLFGMAASTPTTRQQCLDRGVLRIAMENLIHGKEKIRDIAGQIIYGMFHISPLPTAEESVPLFEMAEEALSIKDEAMKYVLWAIRFSMSELSSKIYEYKLVPRILELLKCEKSCIIIPLLIIISNLFVVPGNEQLNDCTPLIFPLIDSIEIVVRVQACRTIADFIRDEDTVQCLLDNGIFEKIIDVSINEEQRIREQAVYAVIRAFNLGSRQQMHKISDMGGTKAVFIFTTLAQYPFNCHLIDCLISLLENDFDFFATALKKEPETIKSLESLLSNNMPDVSRKAANLIGYIGESY